MPTLITKIPDAPILIARATEGENRAKEMHDGIVMIAEALDAQTTPIFLIIDMAEITLDLNEIMQSASLTARGGDSMLHHANLRESIFVLTNRFIIKAVQGLNSATFGRVKARVFATLDEALAYCRGQDGDAF